ncbi:MAG: HAD-IB family hydrolase [Acidimicrobiales bacterium]|nr:HAD-IB family hydrolase [Acidimicrobiales bacterium]
MGVDPGMTADYSRDLSRAELSLGDRFDASGDGQVAIFDVDRTLLCGSSAAALARVMVRAKILKPSALVGAAARELFFRRFGSNDQMVERVRRRALSTVAGLETRDLRRLAEEVAADLEARTRPSVRAMLDKHLDRGDFVVLLSAAPQELVEALAREVGAHRAVGTQAQVVDGRYTGELEGAFCYGPGKLIRLAEAVGDIDLRSGTAYADSSSDLALLLAVGSAVAVCPDSGLERAARAYGWPVILQ